MAGGAALAVATEEPDDHLWLAGVGGAIAAVAVAVRDSQYRSVPADLATTPRRFAAEVEIALDANLRQLQAAQATAQRLEAAATDLQGALTDGYQALAEPVAHVADPGVPLGRGFE